MYSENIEEKLRNFIDEQNRISQEIHQESRNRPARELKSIAESQGWWLERTPGDHKIYKHNEHFEYPNYPGYITIDDCNNNLYRRQVREELQKIFAPKRKSIIQALIADSEIRITLRKWLSLIADDAESSDVQKLVNEVANLRQQLYIRNQEIQLLSHSVSLETIQNSVDDQQTLEVILHENQQLVDQKNTEINQLLNELTQKEDELADSLNRIESLQLENANLLGEIAQFQARQQHLIQLEQNLSDLHQQEQELQRQLNQAEIQRQNQVEALNQQRQQLIQQHRTTQHQLTTQIATLNSQIQQLEAENQQLQAWATELQQNLNQVTLSQPQIVRTTRRAIQKPLWISSAIVAAIVAFNPGPRLINAVAVAAIPTATIALQKRRH